MKKAMIPLLLAAVLTACNPPLRDSHNVRVIIDPSLAVACPALPKIEAETITMGELYTKYSQLQAQYIECAIRNDCLIEAVKTAEDTPEDKRGVRVTCPALERLPKSDGTSHPAQ